MLAGVHAVREAQQPGSSLVYGALAHLDLHCGPSAAGKGVDLLEHHVLCSIYRN